MIYPDYFEEDPPEDDPAKPVEFPTGVINPDDAASAPVDAAGGGGGGDGAGGYNPAARPTFNWPALPGFKPPKWNAPTLEDAQNEPGYAFRSQQGEDALQRSAAAKGVLRTGGTLKDLIEYGQNFASQEYGNVFNRALQGYDRTYKSAYDKYAPLLAQWNMQAGAERASGLAAYDREWQQYMFDHRGGGGGGGVYDPEPLPPDVSSYDDEDYRKYAF